MNRARKQSIIAGVLLLAGQPICGKINGSRSLCCARTRINTVPTVIRLRTCHLPLTFHRREGHAVLLMIAAAVLSGVDSGRGKVGRREELITGHNLPPARCGHTVSRARNNEICR